MSNPDSFSIRRRAPVPKELCPLALAAEIIGDRWTLLVLREAFYGVTRYDDMREDLCAPRSMLSDRLRKMVDNGLMTRNSYQEPGTRVRQAYVLTDAGRDLALTLMALTQWGEQHLLNQPSPVTFVEIRTDHSLRVGLVDEEGRETDIQQATIKVQQKAN